jgi:hypothetical protein
MLYISLDKLAPIPGPRLYMAGGVKKKHSYFFLCPMRGLGGGVILFTVVIYAGGMISNHMSEVLRINW